MFGAFLKFITSDQNVSRQTLIVFVAICRYIGTVISAKPKKGCLCRVRIKFDMYPKDKFDKW